MILNQVYKMANPTPAIEDMLLDDMRQDAIRCGILDMLGQPQPMDGVRHEEHVMQGVQYIADNGGVKWNDRAVSRQGIVSDLGYASTSNCMAMIREAEHEGLITVSIRGGEGWTSVTDYGYSQLDRWEFYRDE